MGVQARLSKWGDQLGDQNGYTNSMVKMEIQPDAQNGDANSVVECGYNLDGQNGDTNSVVGVYLSFSEASHVG